MKSPALLLFFLASCAADAGSGGRAPLDKADNIGSCLDHCGDQSAGSCFCDSQCEEIGDCCADYEDECKAPPSMRFSCGEHDSLRAVTELVASGGSCGEWVSAEYGRVARVGAGSGGIWSRRNRHGLGILLGASHTRGEGFFGEAGSEIDAFVGAPTAFTASSFVHLPGEDGGTPQALASGVFLDFHAAIPAAESGNKLQDILPVHDFFMAVVDSQQLQSELGQIMGDLLLAPLTIRDPLELSTSAQTFASVDAGQEVLYMGYPNDGEHAGVMAAGFGEVLSDDEALAVLQALEPLGDEEALVPYDPEVEILFTAHARPGMSGGPIYDSEGRQVALLVRATTTALDGQFYARGVRLDFIFAELERVLAEAEPAVREAIAPFLEEP